MVLPIFDEMKYLEGEDSICGRVIAKFDKESEVVL